MSEFSVGTRIKHDYIRKIFYYLKLSLKFDQKAKIYCSQIKLIYSIYLLTHLQSEMLIHCIGLLITINIFAGCLLDVGILSTLQVSLHDAYVS